MPYHLALAPYSVLFINDSDGNRTRVTAVKGRCLNRLTTEPYFPGFSRFLASFNQIRKHLIRFQEGFLTRLVYHLAKCFQTPRVGLEPTTSRLTAVRSTIELSRIIFPSYPQNRTLNSSYLLLNIFPILTLNWLSPRPISNIQLNTLLHLHLCPIYLVLSKGSYLLGYLILRGASRLDAFSVYPCRTWLLCHRIGS